MKSSFINPLDLPLIPPMDLNAVPGMPEISAFPMQLRVRKGTGLFGAIRDDDEDELTAINNGLNQPTIGLIRPHNGVDLLAPDGTKVYASTDGKAIEVNPSNVLILHDFGVKFLTYYSHVRPIVAQGAEVTCGQQIAAVAGSGNECHLHFELRYALDNTNPTSRLNTLPIDPTYALYYWEIKAFQNDSKIRSGFKSRNEIDNAYIISIDEVVIGKQLRFLKCMLKDKSIELFLPIQTGLHEDDILRETIVRSFFAAKKTRIVWRESLFFGKILTPFNTGTITPYVKASIIAEIKVYQENIQK